MRRRLDLAASLVSPPAVIFLDEPTTGLDPRSRQQMWQVISDLTGTGVTVFLTTQYLEEADRLADRIAIVDGGRLVAEGTAGELKRRIADQRLDLTLADRAAFDEIVRHLGTRASRSDPARRTITLPTDGSAAQIRGLLDELDPGRTAIERFAVHGATLDDVFLALTGRPATTTDTTETNGIAETGDDTTKETADV
jgi:ABC-2 type transport system ATP-binding protein